jgi:hypothetical protein
MDNENLTDNNLLEIFKEDISANLNDIVNAGVAVWRINRDNQLVVVPVKKLGQYLGDKDDENSGYYIEKNWRERIKEHESFLTGKSAPVEEPSIKDVQKFGNVEKQSVIFHDMPVAEREGVLDKCISSLMKIRPDTLDVGLTVKMVEIMSSSLFANNANLEDNLKSENMKDDIYGVLTRSELIVQILVSLFNQKKYSYEDMDIIETISTGSKTIDHINKVFLRFLMFSIFFNDYIGEGLFTKNIRGVFRDRYLRYYKKKFPDMNISVERIFKDGIRRIDKDKELQNYMLGAILFDIGKLCNIKYHDSLDPYNEEIVKKHALNGYNMIVSAHRYPFPVLAMAAFHHEYYGAKGSYNFTKPLLSRFSGKHLNEENIKYFISYEKEDFIHGESLAFFPCKVLEIIDVFDAMIYKKNIPILETLNTMKKEFIIRNLKLDPILFRIFLEYQVRCTSITASDMEDIDSLLG